MDIGILDDMLDECWKALALVIASPEGLDHTYAEQLMEKIRKTQRQLIKAGGASW